MGFNAPSGEELEARGGNFKPLPGDGTRYRVRVIELEEKLQANPYDRTEDEPDGKKRPVLNVKMDVLSFEDGTALYDVEGNDVDDKKFFAFLDLTKIGMKPQPSITRRFITSAQNIPVESQLDVADWQELIGAEMIAVADINKNGKNKVTAFYPLRSRPPRAQRPAQPVAQETVAEAAQPDEEPAPKRARPAPAPAEPVTDEDAEAAAESMLAAARSAFPEAVEF